MTYAILLEQQMEEGYKVMAGENLQFASAAINLAQEVLPEWKQYRYTK